MTSNLDPLRIRHRLGRAHWGLPQEFGPDGWIFLGAADSGNYGQVIVSCAEWPDEPWKNVEFVHASIARPEMPTYRDLCMLRRACFKGYAYQVFPPEANKVNIHATALHLWGRLDGKAWLPDFTMGGKSI
jgi:hypothetical protein